MTIDERDRVWPTYDEARAEALRIVEGRDRYSETMRENMVEEIKAIETDGPRTARTFLAAAGHFAHMTTEAEETAEFARIVSVATGLKWGLAHTGGGCTALDVTVGETYYMLTDEDAHAPRGGEGALLGRYGTEEMAYSSEGEYIEIRAGGPADEASDIAKAIRMYPEGWRS